MFNCNKCGACCLNLNLNSLYDQLNDGNGVCIYYNKELKICNIYSERPIICRIDEVYDSYYKDFMSKNEYYELNYEGCRRLKGVE